MHTARRAQNESVIQWAQTLVSQYGVEVADLNAAWSDGYAFGLQFGGLLSPPFTTYTLNVVAELLDLDFNSLKWGTQELSIQNMTEAFLHASNVLGIAPLNATEVARRPDSRDIFNYLQQCQNVWYKTRHDELAVQGSSDTNPNVAHLAVEGLRTSGRTPHSKLAGVVAFHDDQDQLDMSISSSINILSPILPESNTRSYSTSSGPIPYDAWSAEAAYSESSPEIHRTNARRPDSDSELYTGSPMSRQLLARERERHVPRGPAVSSHQLQTSTSRIRAHQFASPPPYEHSGKVDQNSGVISTSTQHSREPRTPSWVSRQSTSVSARQYYPDEHSSEFGDPYSPLAAPPTPATPSPIYTSFILPSCPDLDGSTGSTIPFSPITTNDTIYLTPNTGQTVVSIQFVKPVIEDDYDAFHDTEEFIDHYSAIVRTVSATSRSHFQPPSKVVVGTYEKTLLGWEALDNSAGDYEPGGPPVLLIRSFAQQPHGGCVKSLNARGKWLASGSSDECIKVFDLAKRQEFGTLTEHRTTVTAVAFGEQYLLAGDDDGDIRLYRFKDWECVRTLKAHTVNSISVHPSGKVALSVSKDRTMHLWNLANARSAHRSVLTFEPEQVLWSPNGSTYAFIVRHRVRVYDQSGEEKCTFEDQAYQPIRAFAYLSEDLIAFGGEGGVVDVFSISSGKRIATLKGFNSRIRCLAAAPRPTTEAKANMKTKGRNADPQLHGTAYLVSACSDGTISIWDLSSSLTTPIATTTAKCRPVCMCVTEAFATDKSASASKVDIESQTKPEKSSQFKPESSIRQGKTDSKHEHLASEDEPSVSPDDEGEEFSSDDEDMEESAEDGSESESELESYDSISSSGEDGDAVSAKKQDKISKSGTSPKQQTKESHRVVKPSVQVKAKHSLPQEIAKKTQKDAIFKAKNNKSNKRQINKSQGGGPPKRARK